MNSDSARKTVVFLGAGASAADGAPVQANLLSEYFADRDAERCDSNGVNRKAVLARFFARFYGKNLDIRGWVDCSPFPTFEEILGILDLAESQGETFRGLGTGTLMEPDERWTIPRIRELLILMIAEILDSKLKGPAKHHPQLVKKLTEAQSLADCSFVSLNYDILIDNALLTASGGYGLDYGVEFGDGGGLVSDEKRVQESIKLLKLHGSLNWLYCPTCRALALTPREKGVCRLKTDPRDCACARCASLSAPIIIPPTYFKVLSNLYLRQICDAAERVLVAADRIVFCGYSFPDADVHVRYLLKRMEVNGDNRPQIFIVNERAGKSDQARQAEKERFSRFFCEKHKVHWTGLSFEEFARDPTAIDEAVDSSV